MSYLINSTYAPSVLFKNGHINTIYRVGFDTVKANFTRKRVELNDGDFIDLDFSTVSSNQIVVITHGLEGSSNSSYVVSLTAILNNNGYDVVAINLRGCSGEPNRLLCSYHSGKTEDLDQVITYLQSNFTYSEINLVGYSLGGNLTLKYIGETERTHIHSAVAISAPCDLKSTALKMNSFSNRIYLKRFLKTLKMKAYQKADQFPGSFLTKETITNLKTFKDFDDFYTAPAHHFKNAEDYWEKASCKQFIPSIKTNSLLINAFDDPFLTNESFPIKEAIKHTYFHLETPKYGGHVGFVSYLNITKLRWCENRILSFLQKGI